MLVLSHFPKIMYVHLLSMTVSEPIDVSKSKLN